MAGDALAAIASATLGAPMMRAFTDLHWTLSRRTMIGALVTGAASLLSGCGTSSSFCNATTHGATAGAVISAYVHTCGSDYSISRGPYDAGKATTPYAAYAHVVEYTVSVKRNAEGPLAFLEVGQRVAGMPWQTLGPPGTGP